jgi:hypothetical protein
MDPRSETMRVTSAANGPVSGRSRATPATLKTVWNSATVTVGFPELKAALVRLTSAMNSGRKKRATAPVMALNRT